MERVQELFVEFLTLLGARSHTYKARHTARNLGTIGEAAAIRSRE